jgi:hypothetical protein
MKRRDLHVVALHNHMIGEQPAYYFTCFWGKSPATQLTKGFKAALKVQEQVKKSDD